MLGDKQENILKIVTAYKDIGISQTHIIDSLKKENKSALAPNVSRDLKKLENRKLLMKKGSIYFPVL